MMSLGLVMTMRLRAFRATPPMIRLELVVPPSCPLGHSKHRSSSAMMMRGAEMKEDHRWKPLPIRSTAERLQLVPSNSVGCGLSRITDCSALATCLATPDSIASTSSLRPALLPVARQNSAPTTPRMISAVYCWTGVALVWLGSNSSKVMPSSSAEGVFAVVGAEEGSLDDQDRTSCRLPSDPTLRSSDWRMAWAASRT